MDASAVGEAFRHHEIRKVDKAGCISFCGKRYETNISLIGHKVEISYDPASPEEITIHAKGIKPFVARPLEIGAYCSNKQPLSPSLEAIVPETSRFLDALERKYQKNKKLSADAISFGEYKKEVSL